MTTARDAAAYKLIYDTRAARYTRASTRAEKWIAGLTALVTVLTTAMVVKGPENFAKAEGAVRGVVLLLVVIGVLGVSAGLVFAYSAAFGGLLKPSAVDRLIETPPTTAADAASKLDTAATADARTSRRSMKAALGATVLAMVSLTVAIGVSWFATAKDATDSTTCLKTDAGVVQLSGDVTVRSGTVEYVDCP